MHDCIFVPPIAFLWRSLRALNKFVTDTDTVCENILTARGLLVWQHPAVSWWPAGRVLPAVADISTCQSAAVTQCSQCSWDCHVSTGRHYCRCQHWRLTRDHRPMKRPAAGQTRCQAQTADVLFHPVINTHTYTHTQSHTVSGFPLSFAIEIQRLFPDLQGLWCHIPRNNCRQ